MGGHKNLFSLTGKIALVTGASSGLGEQFARDLAAEGASVIVAGRRVEKLSKLVDTITEAAKTDPTAGQAVALPLDVTAGEEAIDAAVEKAASIFGRIDILVNSAGVYRGGPVLEHSYKDFKDLFDTNVTGMWLVARAVGRKMAADGKGGSIINIGSCMGVSEPKMAGSVGYTATKSALKSITETMALELGKHGIRVNTIAPGLFPTEMTDVVTGMESVQAFFAKVVPAGRVGDASSDLYGTVVLLASDAGRYITGSCIVVDGGLTLCLKNFAEGV